ncbi:MAG: hypothetical protein OPY03_04940, partial [Nitrosopumilus sp.]|nr:hypothetical protein [Nitrosopumilus sp.]
MKKIFKYSVIILFAVMMMTSTIVAFADTHSPSDRCLTQNILAYRPVVMTLVHDDAIIVDPKFTIPHGEESINIQPSQRTEDDRTSNGFVINGTGTYIIEYGLTHAGNKAVTENNPYGQRQIDLTINSAGFPLIFDRDMYSVPDFCKIYTLQITNPPFIPTDEEFAELAYGIITPYIEAVEKQVQLNTDQVQRSDDRTGIFTIIMIGLVALVVFLNNANRKEKAETIEDYRLINQRLRNQEQQNLIDSREFDRRTDEALEKQKNVLKGFMTYFDARVETKINDLGFIIHHFFTTLNEAQFNIPEYQTPEAIDQTFPEP